MHPIPATDRLILGSRIIFEETSALASYTSTYGSRHLTVQEHKSLLSQSPRYLTGDLSRTVSLRRDIERGVRLGAKDGQHLSDKDWGMVVAPNLYNDLIDVILQSRRYRPDAWGSCLGKLMRQESRRNSNTSWT